MFGLLTLLFGSNIGSFIFLNFFLLDIALWKWIGWLLNFDWLQLIIRFATGLGVFLGTKGVRNKLFMWHTFVIKVVQK